MSPRPFQRRAASPWTWPLLALLLTGASLTTSCRGGDEDELARLRAENEGLRSELAEARATDVPGADDAAPTRAAAATAAPADDWSWADETSASAEPEVPPPTPVSPAPARTLPPPPPPRAEPEPVREPRRPAPAPEPERVSRLEPPPEAEPEPAPPVVLTVAAGSALEARLDRQLDAGTAQVGEGVTATLEADLEDAEGRVVLPAGTSLAGRVVEAVSARRVRRKSVLAFRLESATLADGSVVPVSAGLRIEGEGWTRRDGAVIGGSAAGGAILGQVLGGDSEATTAGAVLGGAIATGVIMRRRGEDVTIPAGTFLSLDLELPVRIERPAT